MLLSPIIAGSIVILYAFATAIVNGPHPSCNVESDVGSCNLVGSSFNLALWLTLPGFLIWVAILPIGLLIISRRIMNK